MDLRPLLLIVGISLLAPSGPAVAEEPDENQEVDRYACRHEVQIPAGSIVSTLDSSIESITFSTIVDDIVARLTLSTFDDYLRGLSGDTQVLISGLPHTFNTRYSLTPEGELAWVYAYEQLAALGYSVSYHEYTRSGNNLKNIVATIPGQVTPNEVYVIGGHIDSTSPDPHNLAPGAEDNGSGSSAVLAAAAALAGEQFESTIELILFSGEEQGLWGSQAYVTDAIAAGKDIKAAVTMDMIAYFNNDYGVLIEGGNSWETLMQAMADAVDNYTTIGREFSYFSFGSDHVPFQNAGIPAILAIDLDWAEYPYYHRTTDTYDKTTPALGLEIAKASLATVAQLAGPLGATTDVGSASLTFEPVRMFPNPATSSLEIRLSAGASLAELANPVQVFDVTGREIRTIASSTTAHASGSLTWDLRDDNGTRVHPGLYWIRTGNGVAKVAIVR